MNAIIQKIIPILLQIIGAGAGTGVALFVGYHNHPKPILGLTVAFASAFAWAIGSVVGGAPWWNGNTNIIAAWLSILAAALSLS